jgi:hypothetical protein
VEVHLEEPFVVRDVHSVEAHIILAGVVHSNAATRQVNGHVALPTAEVQL